jgi:heme-degrading monooxygenase HmoA
MKANVTTAQVQPGKVEEAVRIYRDVVIPDIQQQQGFKAAFLLTDPTTGQGVSITMWETEADLLAAVASSSHQAHLAEFARVFAGPPTRGVYEVSVQA